MSMNSNRFGSRNSDTNRGKKLRPTTPRLALRTVAAIKRTHGSYAAPTHSMPHSYTRPIAQSVPDPRSAMRLRIVPELRRPAARGTAPIAITDHGVVVADEGGSVDGEEGALELTEPGDHMEPLPELNPDVAYHVYVVGPSGCGKSTVCGKIAKRFRKTTGGLVIVISMDDQEDPAIDCADVRLSCEQAADLTLEDLMGEEDDDGDRQRVLVAFDDHLCGGDKHVIEAVLNLQRAVIQRGRKFGVSSLTTAHRPATGRESRFILSGMSNLVIFPGLGASRSLRYVLETYASLPAELIGLLRRDPVGWGRAVNLRLAAPMVAVGDRRAACLCPETIESVSKALKKTRVARITKMQEIGSDDEGGDGTAVGAIAAAHRRRSREQS